MIISASRRTDIPAFFTPWFMNRIDAGYCTVVNPLNSKQVSYVSLAPEDVDAIVFWTKNPSPMIPKLRRLSEFKFYFQYTITGYETLEVHVPKLARSLLTFHSLSHEIGSERVIWRYDPIIVSERMGFGWPNGWSEYHVRMFDRIARLLAGYTHRVVISILDLYRKTVRNLEPYVFEHEPQKLAGFGDMIEQMAAIAKTNGMEIQSCSEKVDLRPYGVQPGKCIDEAILQRAFNLVVSGKKDVSQRESCGCVKSRDIGAYDTCKHHCLYCYATEQKFTTTSDHDPKSPSITGWHDAEPPTKQLGLKLSTTST